MLCTDIGYARGVALGESWVYGIVGGTNSEAHDRVVTGEGGPGAAALASVPFWVSCSATCVGEAGAPVWVRGLA